MVRQAAIELAGPKEEDIRASIIALLNFLGDKGLKVSKSKLQFAEPEVKYLGHWLTKGKKKLDPERIAEAIVAVALLVEEPKNITFGAPLVVYTPHNVRSILQQKADKWLTDARLLKYEAILIHSHDLELRTTAAQNPAQFLFDEALEEPTHNCAEVVELRAKIRPDLEEEELEEGEKWFVDGSARVIEGKRKSGYAIVDGIYELAKQEVQGCMICQRIIRARLRQTLLGGHFLAYRPFERIQIDFTELPKNWASVAQHRFFSKWNKATLLTPFKIEQPNRCAMSATETESVTKSKGAQTTQLLVEPPWRPAVPWDQVTLTCQGLGTAGASTWYKDGQRWRQKGLYNFTVTENGNYMCDCPANGLSHPITTLNGPVADATITPSPPAHQVHVGDPVTLHCSAQVGSAPVTFTWLHNGQDVARGPVLELGDVSVGHSGTYQCVATYQLGEDRHRVFHELSPELELEVTPDSPWVTAARKPQDRSPQLVSLSGPRQVSPGPAAPRDPQVTNVELLGPYEGQHDPSDIYENVL
ncbi:hypothetical protein HGM15179_019477 [Zosterops borbonicus]|uniref:Ig-like domain-containing protein n=1 Tax=Zosterops borbonicus TaxID=364589 RepID=A0A8K1FXK1_9PASS|nr:hypothetical protein HGM15179_019477 [Zosterops borbonicus]